MTVTRTYLGKKDIMCVGYEREDTKIGGAGVYGSTVALGRVVWPGEVQSVTIDWGKFKDQEAQLGGTYVRKVVQTGQDQPTFVISEYPVDEYEGYASLLGYVLGSNPAFSHSEIKGTTSTGQGVITVEDQLGSFTMETGIYNGTTVCGILARGCEISKFGLYMEAGKRIERRCNINAQKIEDIESAFTVCSSTSKNVDNLTAPTGRAMSWKDCTFTWSTGTHNLTRFTLEIDRGLEWNPQLGEEYTAMPTVGMYRVTGEFDELALRADNTTLNIARKNGTTWVAGTDYIDTLTIVINNSVGYYSMTLADMVLKPLGSYELGPGTGKIVNKYAYEAVSQLSNAKVHA